MCPPEFSLVLPNGWVRSSHHQQPGIDWFAPTNGDGLGSVSIQPNQRSVSELQLRMRSGMWTVDVHFDDSYAQREAARRLFSRVGVRAN